MLSCRQQWTTLSSGLWCQRVVVVGTDVSVEHMAYFFRVKDSTSLWFDLRLYLMTNGEESFLQSDLQSRVCYHGVIFDKSLLRRMWWLATPWRTIIWGLKNAVFWDKATPCCSLSTAIFVEHMTSIFMVKEAESTWLLERMYHTTDWEKSLLQR